MKIYLSSREKHAMETILRSEQPTTIDKFFGGSPLLRIEHGSCGDMEIEVNEQYMSEYLNACAESASILVPMIKAVGSGLHALAIKLDSIVRKNVERVHNDRMKAMDGHMKANGGTESVIQNLCNALLRQEGKVPYFDKLDPATKEFLLISYGDTIITVFNERADIINKMPPF